MSRKKGRKLQETYGMLQLTNHIRHHGLENYMLIFWGGAGPLPCPLQVPLSPATHLGALPDIFFYRSSWTGKLHDDLLEWCWSSSLSSASTWSSASTLSSATTWSSSWSFLFWPFWVHHSFGIMGNGLVSLRSFWGPGSSGWRLPL